ncbi:hypothetical protein [Streptomyces sp. NPDC058401]|uniref:hypothetical protein n=1 Tax=Streptomyces sp. NPDC058401 TaxID=3346480 RepID=UPI0036463F07
MSFRVRVFALFILVVVTATAATAWLTLAQVTRQVRESTAADRQVVAGITEELRETGAAIGAACGRQVDQRMPDRWAVATAARIPSTDR